MSSNRYDEEDETEEQSREARFRRQRDEDEDDEEDEEEEEEEDDEDHERGVQKHPKKRQRRQKANPFIDYEAAVDEDDEEDDEEAEDGFDQEAEEVERTFHDESRHRAFDRRVQQEEDTNAEAIAERFKQRYGRSEMSRGAYRGDLDHVPQSVLIPSVNDPKLWLIRCKPGKEKIIVMQMMRKFDDLELTSKTPLEILSVFSRDSLQGYVYIEAMKQAHVMAAIQGVNNIYVSKLQLVPVNEMVDCLSIKGKTLDLKTNAWVRVKRGRYDGDLAQVLEVAESGDTALVKLIPRLEPARGTLGQVQSRRKKGTDVRQPQKLFQPSDFNKREINAGNGGYTYQGDFFDKDGYLEKTMKVTSLLTEMVNPTLDEITKFSGGSINEQNNDLALLASANQATTDDFQIGEGITVISGELKNVPGVIQSIEGGIVTVIPDKSFGLSGPLRYPARDIAKRFEEGNHVKVVGGVHKDETGLIVKIDNNVVTILSDTSLNPISVFSKDLRTASEVSAVGTSLGQYDTLDLVQLSASDVGVIVKIEKDILLILNQYGNLLRVKPQQIQSKRDSSRAVTSDSHARPVTAGDHVVVSDPSSTIKRSGTVLHIFRSHVFVKSREIVEDNGIIVARNSNLVVMGGKVPMPAFGSHAPGAGRGNAYNPYAASTGLAGQGRSGGPGGMGRGRGRGRGRDEFVGKTVTICGGPYKGYLGIVKDATETHARVELHTGNKTINMEKTKLSMHGAESRSMQSQVNAGYNGYADRYDRNSNMGSRTPSYSGSKTPMYRSNTESATPNPHMDGGRTPAWDSGSRTPAWNASSKTPAWEASSRTPARPDSFFPGADHMPYQNALADNADTPYIPSTPAVDGMHGQSHNVTGTPGAYPSTPAAHNLPQTPLGGIGGQYPNMGSVPNTGLPQTPFVPATPFNPSTPANVHGDYYGSPNGGMDVHVSENWLCVGIEVRIIQSQTGRRFRDGQYDGRRAAIKTVEQGNRNAQILFLDGGVDGHGGEVISGVPDECLGPIHPEKKEAFKVLKGEYRDYTGVLLSIDMEEGVVRLDGRSDILMMDMSSLAKIHASSE
ncbi:transcription elongation factor spt5 [Batrachochytrium dendrobatidis]|nr:transcription elongation factor spt5 [Batrachochytrium dendrobatidis]